LSFVYLFVGAESRSVEFVEREIAANYYGGIFRDPWAPPSASLRKTEAFKTFVRKARFVEYWRARGWPEFCHPAGADDCHKASLLQLPSKDVDRVQSADHPRERGG